MEVARKMKMKIKKFINNSFKILKKTTPEDLHIKYLLENNKYSKIYELFQNGVNFSKTIEYDLPYYFLNFLQRNCSEERKIRERALPAVKEFPYLFKLLNSNNSLRENFVKILSEGEKDKIFSYGSEYGRGIDAFYNHIMEGITCTEEGLYKNTTELNIEFFKFIKILLEEPNKLPNNFTLPKEFVFMFLLENSTTKTKDLDIFLKISCHYYLVRPLNEDDNSVLSENNMLEYFKELRYKVGQAKIQKLPSIDLGSDEMQLKIIKSIVKPQISDINQIQAFIDSHNLSEDIKKSLTMITSTLNYLNNEKLPPEDKNIVDKIKETLYKNLNEYDSVMEFLDKEDTVDYKTIYSDISSKLYQVLADYEKIKLKDLESTNSITKVRFK